MPSIASAIAPERVVDISDTEKGPALAKLVTALSNSSDNLDHERLLAAINSREDLSPTGIGEGLALPHARLPELKSFVLGLGRLSQGVEFDAPDGQPVHLMCMLVGPDNPDRQPDYLKLLRSATQFMRNERDRLLSLDDVKMAYALFQEY